MIIPNTFSKLQVISDSDPVKNQTLTKVGGTRKSSTYRDLRISDLRTLFIFAGLYPGLRIRIRIGSGFNRVSGSESGSRRAKMTHKSRKIF